VHACRDGSAQQQEYEFESVRLELELFSPSLVDKPYVVVFNKMYLPEASERWNTFGDKIQSEGCKHTRCHSCAYNLLQQERQRMKEAEGWSGTENVNHVSDAIKKERRAPMNEFEVFYDKGTNTWNVVEASMEHFVQMIYC